MKSIKLKLLILFGLIVLICSTLLFHRTYSLVTSNINNLTKQQLSLARNFELSIREYVAEKVRPLMFKMISEKHFIPETMSTSFVARRIFEKVKVTHPDYIIKFSAENPRNPFNKAGKEELKMIDLFNENPIKKDWTGDIVIGGKKYLATFSALRMEKSCLRCHGDPADAPIELIKMYGPNTSFHRPLGKVAGLTTIAIPSKTLEKLLLNEKFRNLGFLGIVILFLIISLIFVCKFVVTDRLCIITNHFLSAENQSGELEIELLDIKGNDEIATLATSFNKLAKRFNDTYTELTSEINKNKQIQEALVESEEKYRKLFDMESDALALIDIQSGKILDVNNMFIDLYGYTKGEVLCMKNTDFSSEPDKTIKATEDRLHYIPLRYHKKKNGEVFPVEITASVLEYKGKNVHFVAIRDITDRKLIEQQIEASLKEKEILLSEIHHRVKNNFEIISSLLDMASMNSENLEVKNLLLGSRTRIHSMAMIHSQLYQSKWFNRVDMVNHINELTENLRFLYKGEKKIKIVIEPSEVYLSLKQAIPCALIINELVTNSLKYAFVNKEQGKIQISIQNANDSTVMLRVKDDGGGISKSVETKLPGSLGLELVEHLAVGQLKGEINMNQNDGTEIYIKFKRQ